MEHLENKRDDAFEFVYTVPDWYDGPRRGVADYQGRPHLYESEWRDGEDMKADTFLLTPIDEEVFEVALEDWKIWRRWETAFHQGKTTQDTHPALPEDQERRRELDALLKERLVSDSSRTLRMRAEFRVRHDPEWSSYGFRPLEVRWEPAAP